MATNPISRSSNMQSEPNLATLMLLGSFASVSAVLYTPAMPRMAEQFGITNSDLGLTMTIFLLGYALGSLPYGPLSNRFGRKPAIFCGLALAIVGSLMCALVAKTGQYSVLLLGRFVQALGSSVGNKIVFTIIGDVYRHEKATQKIAWVLAAFAVGPALGVALGGFLTHHIGWASCFYFLALYGFLLAVLCLWLPETSRERDVAALNWSNVLSGYLAKLRSKKLIVCALLMGCTTSVVYLFASLAPFIGIGQVGLTEDGYGRWYLIPPVGMLLGSFFAHVLAGKKVRSVLAIFIGGTICFVSAVAMAGLFLAGSVNSWTLFLPMPFMYFGLSLVFSNASSVAMSHATNKSNASAVLSFLNITSSVIVLAAIERADIQSVSVLPLLLSLMAIAVLGLNLWLNKINSENERPHLPSSH